MLVEYKVGGAFTFPVAVLGMEEQCCNFSVKSVLESVFSPSSCLKDRGGLLQEKYGGGVRPA